LAKKEDADAALWEAKAAAENEKGKLDELTKEVKNKTKNL